MLANRKIADMINERKRLAATCRRFKFEAIKSLGIFWLINKTPWLRLKEPWNKMYNRSRKSK